MMCPHVRAAGPTLALLACVSFLTACGPVLDTQLKMFRESDALLAHGRYEEAVASYGELIEHYPASGLADDAYLRIAYVLLLRKDPTRSWPGWSGADYRAARDTLGALLARYPRSDRTLETRNWILLLDAYVALAGERRAASDSIAELVSARRGNDAAHAGLEAELATARVQADRVRAKADSLEMANRRMVGRNAELNAELRRIREETERMRRVLIELERRSGGM